LNTRDTIVLGASAGGVDALTAIAAALPERLPAAVLVVLHIGPHRSILPEMLQKAGRLPAHHARDGERVVKGNIYVAPPDLHMVVQGDVVRTICGPKQNFARPSIDPLFRSAAIARGPRVIGAVLTGHLDDGTAGLAAVHACGGITIVQDPDDAQAPDMPRNAMLGTVPDYVLPIDKLASTIAALAGSSTAGTPVDQSRGLMAENDVMLTPHSTEHMSKVGDPTGLSCPECGGALWRLEAPPPARYRCHTGHAFGSETLAAAGDLVIERSLWQAVRALHEKKALSAERAAYHTTLGEQNEARRFAAQARDADEAACALERLLYRQDQSS
jgi:two-component system chemotaxis response regulator CheB